MDRGHVQFLWQLDGSFLLLGLLGTSCTSLAQGYAFLGNSVAGMANMTSADEGTSTRLSNYLGFIDTSIARIVDGSCEVLETGLRDAVNLAGERCRPYAEEIERQTSHHARKAAHTTKEGTTAVLQKLDPMVISGNLKPMKPCYIPWEVMP